MGNEIDKAAMAHLLRQHGLASAPVHQMPVGEARTLLDLFPGSVRLVARTSRPGTTDRNLPRLVDATALEIIQWSQDLAPGMEILVSPYGHLIASAEVALTPTWALVEAVYGVWELDHRHRPGAVSGERTGDRITWRRSVLATGDLRRRFSFDAGVAPHGPLPGWVLRSFCDWAADHATALDAFASDVGRPHVVKVLFYAEWGMEAINARPLDAGLEVSDRPPAPPAGTPVISNTDQEFGPTQAVLLSVSVAREDASTLDRLIERLVHAGVRTVYLESGLLSHTAIALREAGIAVRRA